MHYAMGTTKIEEHCFISIYHLIDLLLKICENTIWERVTKEISPFTITSKITKYLEINLPKELRTSRCSSWF